MVKSPGFDTFDQLVRENQRVVYQIALSVLGNAADAEDITQDAFVQAHAKLATLSDPQHFRAWVCRIGRNLALNRVRADRRSRRRDDAAARSAPDVIDVESLALDRAFETRVREQIERLPDKLREVLTLCAIDELTPAAVSDILGIPAGTVRSRLHLARKALLRSLAS